MCSVPIVISRKVASDDGDDERIIQAIYYDTKHICLEVSSTYWDKVTYLEASSNFAGNTCVHLYNHVFKTINVLLGHLLDF